MDTVRMHKVLQHMFVRGSVKCTHKFSCTTVIPYNFFSITNFWHEGLDWLMNKFIADKLQQRKREQQAIPTPRQDMNRYYMTLKLLKSTTFKYHRGDQSGSNECSFRFAVHMKGHRVTTLLEMSLSVMWFWAAKCHVFDPTNYCHIADPFCIVFLYSTVSITLDQARYKVRNGNCGDWQEKEERTEKYDNLKRVKI